jgi:eukaryotic-like serine/threonine-protein kinase
MRGEYTISRTIFEPMIGETLGPYRVLEKIGEGGMGDVYRARDTNLERDVAIKVLPSVWASDPDRLARFRREAQVLASLNHPHIAQVYGVERTVTAGSSSATALVMELVEGPTLADRIARGALPVDEASGIARQIVEAFETAHEHGIVHRDLKPANVKVREDGTVKVLDFGLAKITAPPAPGSASAAISPTLTSPVMSQVGIILGTAAYMSPEQARGKAVDKRTDIWAFGCVLFEMLSGRRPFDGDDVTEILASVVKSEPEWSLLPAGVPPRLVRLMKRCLEKNPRHRLRDIGDAQFELTADASEPAPTNAALQPRVWRERAAWIGALAAAAAVGVGGWMLRPAPSPPGHVTRFSIALPEGQRFTTGTRRIGVSPDGNVIVYAANNQLYRRTLDDPEPRVIPGTNDNPNNPEFSPDGRSIVYSTFELNSQSIVLKRVPATGGTAVRIANVGQARGSVGAWSPGDAALAWDGGRIVGSTPSGIWAMPADGGEGKLLVTVQPEQEVATWPRLIDDGRHLLYTVRRAGETGPDAYSIVVQPVDGGTRKVLVTAGRMGMPVPAGYLAYLRGADLMAVRFDEARQTVSGEPVVIASDVGGQIAVSASGTLVHSTATGVPVRTPVWVDRRGNEEVIGIPPQPISLLRLSPDASRLAVTSGGEIGVWTLAKGTMTRLREAEGGHWDVAWMPDGNRLVFSAGTTLPTARILMKAADGLSTATTVIAPPAGFPNDISRDGRFLLYHKGIGELTLFPLDGSASPRQIVKGMALNAVFSPDGRWVAYQGSETGRSEIFVRSFPNLDVARWQVSTAGGRYPVWSPDGREIIYISNSGRLTAVTLDTQKGVGTGNQVELFRTDAYDTGSNSRPYDMHGNRFVFAKVASDVRPTIVVVTNWFQEVAAKVGGRP